MIAAWETGSFRSRRKFCAYHGINESLLRQWTKNKASGRLRDGFSRGIVDPQTHRTASSVGGNSNTSSIKESDQEELSYENIDKAIILLNSYAFRSCSRETQFALYSATMQLRSERNEAAPIEHRNFNSIISSSAIEDIDDNNGTCRSSNPKPLI